MKRMIFSAALAGFATTAQAQEDLVAAGAEAAGEWCARCHDITADGPMKQHPPAFAAIAKYRPEEQIRGRIWFPGLHTGMPEWSYVLQPETVDALTAYILSLE